MMDGSSFSSSIATETAPAVFPGSFSGPLIVRPKKAYALAFAGFALALAGCASGFGGSHDVASVGFVSRVENGAILASQPVGEIAAQAKGFRYTVRLSSGELVSLAQDGRPPIADGVPVVVEYGAQKTRIVPQVAPAI